MATEVFPPFVDQLPQADMEFEGLKCWTLKGQQALVAFMHAEVEVAVPEHHHGAQWGVVLDGSMDLTVGGETIRYGPGDVHYISAGVDHQATLYAGWKGLYVFPR